MADLDGNIRDALEQIRIHGPHSAKGSDGWVVMAGIVRRIASHVRYAVPSTAVEADDLAAAMLVRLQSTSLRQRVTAARSPAAYLRGMARYALIDQLRKSERAVPLGAAVQAIATVDPGDVRPLGSLSDAAVRRLQSAVAALPPAERALVHQRFWAGMSVADIARGLGEPYSRVAVRMFRLTRKLRRALESS